jgi:methionyl-tRNA formyltransferase
MRIFFLCNNWLGWQSLKWLRQQQDEIVGVAVHPSACAKYQREIGEEIRYANGIAVDGSRLREHAVQEQVRDLNAEIAVSILFGYILNPDFLALFSRGCVNLHPALLPHNRGAFPNVWSIVNGTPAGVTLHYVDAGIDTGDVIAQKEVEVKATDTGASLYRRLELEALDLFKKTWPLIREGTGSRVPQPAGNGSCHRRSDVKRIDEIDLNKSYRAGDLINILRARTFAPHAGAYFINQGRRIYLRLELAAESEVSSE